MFLVSGVLWFAWRRFDWGVIVPGAMEALFAVTVPYLAISPVWNVSGHVVLSLTPTLDLTLVDRRFWPLLAIPIVMVPNRLYLNEHTVDQVAGAFLFTAAVVGWVYHRGRYDAPDAGADSRPQ